MQVLSKDFTVCFYRGEIQQKVFPIFDSIFHAYLTRELQKIARDLLPTMAFLRADQGRAKNCCQIGCLILQVAQKTTVRFQFQLQFLFYFILKKIFFAILINCVLVTQKNKYVNKFKFPLFKRVGCQCPIINYLIITFITLKLFLRVVH